MAQRLFGLATPLKAFLNLELLPCKQDRLLPVEKVSPEEALVLQQQAAEASQSLGLEHRWNNPYAPKPY